MPKVHTAAFEKQVKALKPKFGESSAFAITTASFKNRGKKIFKKG